MIFTDFYERDLWEYLRLSQKPLVLYGMGNGADKIISVLNSYGIEFADIFASDGFVRDKLFHGHKISSFSSLEEKHGEMTVLLCFGSERPEVLQNIKKISARQELYAPDVPVIGDGLFNSEYVKSNLSELKKIYELLADRQSKKTFENTVKYKISGKIEYLFDCEVERAEPYESFLKLSDDEVFLDLGAYNGDTVTDFARHVSDYRKIIAVEPDKKSFKRLAANTANLKKIRCESVGISSFCGTGSFGMKGGRGSSRNSLNTEISFSTVDDLALSEKPSLIKADIEGEEVNAITGARRVISEYRPKMLISCYHRTDDLIAIPNAVLNIRNDYKIYMRHFPSLPAWDINYYFV